MSRPIRELENGPRFTSIGPKDIKNGSETHKGFIWTNALYTLPKHNTCRHFNPDRGSIPASTKGYHDYLENLSKPKKLKDPPLRRLGQPIISSFNGDHYDL